MSWTVMVAAALAASAVLALFLGVLLEYHRDITRFAVRENKELTEQDRLLLRRVFRCAPPSSFRIVKGVFGITPWAGTKSALYVVELDAKDLPSLLRSSGALSLSHGLGEGLIADADFQTFFGCDTYGFPMAYETATPIFPPDPTVGSSRKSQIVVDDATSPSLRLFINSHPYIVEFGAPPGA